MLQYTQYPPDDATRRMYDTMPLPMPTDCVTRNWHQHVLHEEIDSFQHEIEKDVMDDALRLLLEGTLHILLASSPENLFARYQ